MVEFQDGWTSSMKDTWFYLTYGIAFGFSAAIQPGPLLTYIISQTLKNGWRRTLPAALAPLISDIPIAIGILFVLSHVPVLLIQLLHLAGGFFLLYLAYGAYKTWRTFEQQPSVQNQTGGQSLFKAVTVIWLNPNPYLGWSLVLGPMLLQGWHENPAHGIALLIGFYATMVISMAGIIILFSFARNLGAKINRALIGLTAIALAGFGVYQIWLGIEALFLK
jgi:threonine/homoserine/homoserine lactone efflux protein